MNVAVLALDLERTLIDDARSGRPRPGLFEFLAFCAGRFGRIALFTTVAEEDAREVLADLADRGYVPTWMLPRLEYVHWSGEHKDFGFVPGAAAEEILLVDDDGGWVRPGQQDRWIPVSGWEGGPDQDLGRVRAELDRLTGGA